MIFSPYFNGQTTVWISSDAKKAVDDVCVEGKQLADLAKFRHYANAGLQHAQANGLLRPEGGGVFVFGGETLVRFVGFYDIHPTSFLLCDAYLKKGQKRGSLDTDRINKVIAFKESKLWQKQSAAKQP